MYYYFFKAFFLIKKRKNKNINEKIKRHYNFNQIVYNNNDWNC